jgi:ribonuclease HI/pterin-4a-carbinolamine dehydratase
MSENTQWQKTKSGLYKQFNFGNFKEAFAFMTRVAELAEAHQHHPRWENEWSVVQIWLSTHEDKNSITDKDYELADAIDNVVETKVSTQAVLAAAPPEVEHIKLFADGGSRGNPGPSASGYVLYDKEDNVLLDEGVYLGITTNNQAEYTALKLGLEQAAKLGAKEVEVYMDSLLVINQMKGIFKIKNRDLWPIHDAIKQLCKKFRKISFGHVPREFNKAADAAVNRALDSQLKQNTAPTE